MTELEGKMTSKLPTSKVNTIMKSSSDVENVSRESSVIMAKAAEMFIRALTQEGYIETNNGKKLDYKHLANVVHTDEKYNFLRDILPKKITVLEFKKIMEKKLAAERGSDGEASSSSDDETSSSSSGSGEEEESDADDSSSK